MQGSVEKVCQHFSSKLQVGNFTLLQCGDLSMKILMSVGGGRSLAVYILASTVCIYCYYIELFLELVYSAHLLNAYFPMLD